MSLELVMAKNADMGVYGVKGYIGEKLKEGFDYNESIPSVALTKEAEELSSKFLEMCKEGVNPFEAFVKVFF